MPCQCTVVGTSILFTTFTRMVSFSFAWMMGPGTVPLMVITGRERPSGAAVLRSMVNRIGSGPACSGTDDGGSAMASEAMAEAQRAIRQAHDARNDDGMAMERIPQA